MSAFERFMDRLSLWIGHAFAWCVVMLTLAISYEVFVRYVLGAPTGWSFDVGYIMYGALFFMSGAYTLSRGGHVRADIVYRLWAPRTQAKVDLVLYIVFFFPGVLALVWAGIPQAAQAIRFGEVSVYSPANIPIYPSRILMPIGATLLALQGIAEVYRCIQCIRAGQWPPRVHDVKELEEQLLEQHQKLAGGAEAAR